MAELWWDCSCGQKNPPKMAYCSNPRCRKPAPWKVKPVPKPDEPDKPKTPKPAWIIRLGVWMTVLTPLILGATFFLPPPWNGIVRAVFEVIKRIINF